MRRPNDSEFLLAYDAHADAIFRFCYVQTSNRERAKDVVQETFVRTWKYLAQGKQIDEFRPFLYRTARNILIDQHRQDRTDSLEQMTNDGFDVADNADTLTTVQASLTVKAIRRLEPKYREAVSLRFIQELLPREIAQITGESENTISVRIHRGLEQIRKILNPEHDR